MTDDDWTNDIPPVTGCSFFTRGDFKHFQWTFEALTIVGFFSPNNQMTTQFIVDQCLNHRPDKMAMPQDVLNWLGRITSQMKENCSLANDFTIPAQIGIVLCHNSYYYTSTLGCQSYMYPSIESSRFSTEIEISGPNQILYRGADTLNFVLITSRGLINFLQNQQIRNPVMYLTDRVKDQLEMCQSEGDLKNVCCWAIESVERDYGQIPFATESLLLCHRFDTPKSTLPEPSTQTMMPLHIASNNTNGDTQNAHDYPIPTETDPRQLYDTAPSVSPISRVDFRRDPRNIRSSEPGGDEHQLTSVRAHVADGFELFDANFKRRFPGVKTMKELWDSPQLRFNDTH